MSKEVKILVVADHDSVKEMLTEFLAGYEPVRYTTSSEVKKKSTGSDPMSCCSSSPRRGRSRAGAVHTERAARGNCHFSDGKARFCPAAGCRPRRSSRVHRHARRVEPADRPPRKISELSQIQQRKKARMLPAKRLCAGGARCIRFTAAKEEAAAHSLPPDLPSR